MSCETAPADLGHAVGVDDQLQPQPQMVEGQETPRLQDLDLQAAHLAEIPRRRAGAGEGCRRQHQPLDGARFADGRADQERPDALEVVDDRTFRFRLNQPYPKMLFALGKSSTPALFIMPERIASTDPYKQISEYVGSGPMRFKKDEWVPGAKAIFEKVRRLCAARTRRRTGWPAASGSISTGSSGRSFPMRLPPPAALSER